MHKIGSMGHAFGVRVDGTSSRRFLRFRRGRFLRLTGPMGRRVLKFDGAFGPEGCGLPLCGNAYKVSVTGLAFCVICDTISSATYFLVSP